MKFGSRFPKRPLEDDFLDSARRLANGENKEHKPPVVINFLSYFAYFSIRQALNSNDKKIVASEQEAEGWRGDYESLEEFAKRRVAEYDALRQNEQND